MASVGIFFISVCLFVEVVFVHAGDTDFILDVRPKIILPGLTESLEVDCSFTVDKSSAMVSLNSLFISRSNESIADYEELASINYLSSHTVNFLTSESIAAEGNLSSRGHSFLKLRWDYPFHFNEGYFRCVAQGQDAVGHNVVYSHIFLVQQSEPSQDDIFEKIREMSAQLVKTNGQISQMTNKIDDLTQKLEESQLCESVIIDRYNQSKRALFHPPFVYGHGMYYLSKHRVTDMDVAQATCNVYGGHLAQIDDETEFKAIKSFLNNYTYGEGVLVEGSDLDVEGTWVFQSNNEPVPFFKWMTGEPNTGRAYNCLSLWRVYSWKMVDLPCTDIPFKTTFLCEVPQTQNGTVPFNF